MAGSKPTSGRTHTGATEQAAIMALAVIQAEKTPPSPKKGFIPLWEPQPSSAQPVGVAL